VFPKPHQLLAIVALIAPLAMVGCSRSELVPLTGSVTLDGQPVAAADITFHNQSGGPSGYGNILPEGTYFAKTGSQEGLKPGEYKISIRVTEVPEKIDWANPKPRKLLSPARYANPGTSGLSYTLPASGGTFDITLTSGS